MKLINVVAKLREEGIQVEYVKRKQGGIQIRQIGEKFYKGTEGNIAARTRAGVQMSAAQIRQREAAAGVHIRRSDIRARARNPAEIDPMLKRLTRQLNKALKAKTEYLRIPQGTVSYSTAEKRVQSLISSGVSRKKAVQRIGEELEEHLATVYDVAYHTKVEAWYQTVKSDIAKASDEYRNSVLDDILAVLSEIVAKNYYMTNFEFDNFTKIWYDWQMTVNNRLDDDDIIQELNNEVLNPLREIATRGQDFRNFAK